MSDRLKTLRDSSARLRRIVEPLTPEGLRAPAYPAEWSVAEVLAHVGSGAVIMQRRVEAIVAAEAVPDDFAPGVWDEWNAKTPDEQSTDALVADAAFIERIDALTDEE